MPRIAAQSPGISFGQTFHFFDHDTTMKPTREENQMFRYLLGQLPEPEEAALEQSFFADSEAFERMWEAENDLVDRYVRGRLTPGERKPFEQHYLASPVHQQRVAAARNLLAAADESAAPALAADSWWSKLNEKLRVPALAWRFGIAAAMVLLTAGCLWLWLDRARLRDEVARIQSESGSRQSRERELAAQIAAARQQNSDLAAELERLRTQQPTPPPSPIAPRQSAPREVFSFLLVPIRVRGGEAQPLTIPPKADRVQLQMTVAPDDTRIFQAAIRTLEGRTVWTQRSIRPRAGKVTVSLPAGKLPFNDYMLTLTAGNREVVERYSFRAIRD